MLSPSNRVVFLPQDREIMDITGMSEEQYRWFVRECYKNQKFRPGEPLALEPTTVLLINLAVSLLLTAASLLLAPKPQDKEEAKLTEETVDGQNVIRRDRFAPKSGFDSVQNVVDLGSIIPIIYCKRQEKYGGVRVNTNLLWSQILSVGGGQFFKGLFLVGEGGVKIDYSQIALGNNTLASYELDAIVQAGRVSLYYNKDGDRITNNDIRAGVTPEEDPGAIAGGGQDIYSLNGDTDFCQALQPSNQLEFGVYNLLGNNFGYKIGEDFEAMSQWQLGDDEYQRQDDNERIALRDKQSQTFCTRAGIVELRKGGRTEPNDIKTNQDADQFNLFDDVEVNDVIIYKIYSSSQQEHEFRKDGAGGGGQPEAIVDNRDVANTIASIQRGYDEAISVGDLFRIGTVLAVCFRRPEEPFISEVEVDEDEADNLDESSDYQFKVVRVDDPRGDGTRGRIHIWNQARDLERNKPDINFPAMLATTRSHLLKTTTASFSVERPCAVLEVGLKSVLNVRSSGIVHFNSLVVEEDYQSDSNYYEDNSYQAFVDAAFCGGLDDGESSDDTYRQTIIPGRYSASDTRYSFFRIEFRDAGDNGDFQQVRGLFSVRSQAGAEVYNFIRFRFDRARRREFRFVPVSSWEIRNIYSTGAEAQPLYAIDYKVKELQSLSEAKTGTDVEIDFFGAVLIPGPGTFAIPAFLNPDSSTSKGGRILQLELTQNATSTWNGNRGPYPLRGGSGAKASVNLIAQGGVVTGFEIVNPGRKYEVGDQLRVDTDSMDDGFPISRDVEFLIREPEWVSQPVANPDGIPIGYADHDDKPYYVDSHARIAEAFVYSEVKSSATQPEHAISYINIISKNDVEEDPNYDNMAIVGLNIRSSFELSTLDQLSVYCEEGIKDDDGNAIHLFPDVFKDLLTDKNYGVGEFFSKEQIDEASFAAASTWTDSKGYYFDGTIAEKVNLRTWGAQRARDFLLDLSVSSGRFTLKPAIDFEKLTPAAMFSSGNIIEDTLKVNYFDTQDRLDPIISVKWREERKSGGTDTKGLFPQLREFTLKRKGVDESAPVIQIDLSAFCTSEDHAIDRAKLECQSKRYITHAVSFKTTPTEAGVQAGSIIKLGIETVTYDQPQNGAVTASGEVTSWPPLEDGDHRVLLWDGNTLSNRTMKVINGKAQGITSAVFCLEESSQRADTYKVSSVSFDEDGNVDIEALYWPSNSDGQSLMTLDWEIPEEWEKNG